MTQTHAAPSAIDVSGSDESQSHRAGLLYGVGAYLWWGLVPTYFKILAHVPALVVLGHRVIGSIVLLAVLTTIGRHWTSVWHLMARPKAWPWLIASTMCIATNWFIFIYSIEHKLLVEASLGYFINPLVTVVLGMVFLSEKMRRPQWAALLIAASGLVYLTIARGGLPWIAIVLPISFGFYGLIRKQAPLGVLTGLFVETLLLLPFFAVYVPWAHLRPGSEAIDTPGTLALLSLAGVITTVPMLWYVAAARKLPLVTLGFLQFVAPSLQMLTAVVAFGEPFGRDRVVACSSIWFAMVLFVVDMLRNGSRGVRGVSMAVE
ncbi:MAG: EamA family transporter RarD [Phycisphaerales bacterium]